MITQWPYITLLSALLPNRDSFRDSSGSSGFLSELSSWIEITIFPPHTAKNRFDGDIFEPINTGAAAYSLFSPNDEKCCVV